MSRTIIRIAIGVVTIAAWAFLGVSLKGGLGPRVDAEPCETSARLMAQAALALLKPGGQINVIARDTSTFSNPASDIQLAGFLKSIGQARAEIGTVRKLQVDPLRPIAVPSGDFCELVRNADAGSVVVSFMGPPRLTPRERAGLGEIQPAIVAFCSGALPEMADMRMLYEQGLLKAAVLDRRGSEPAFQTLTAADLSGPSAPRQSPAR
jgi:hypothetical protein